MEIVTLILLVAVIIFMIFMHKNFIENINAIEGKIDNIFDDNSSNFNSLVNYINGYAESTKEIMEYIKNQNFNVNLDCAKNKILEAIQSNRREIISQGDNIINNLDVIKTKTNIVLDCIHKIDSILSEIYKDDTLLKILEDENVNNPIVKIITTLKDLSSALENEIASRNINKTNELINSYNKTCQTLENYLKELNDNVEKLHTNYRKPKNSNKKKNNAVVSESKDSQSNS